MVHSAAPRERDPRPLRRRWRGDRRRHLRREAPTRRRCTRRRGLRDGSGAVAGEDTVGFCAVRPAGHHAETRAGNGLLPLRQRRHRRRAGDPRAGRRASRRSSTGTSTTATAPKRSSDAATTSSTSASTRGGSSPAPARATDVGVGPAERDTRSTSPVPAGSRRGRLALAARGHRAAGECAFEPDLVLISAGFDATATTRWPSCRLETESFAADGPPGCATLGERCGVPSARCWRAATTSARWPIGGGDDGRWRRGRVGDVYGSE